MPFNGVGVFVRAHDWTDDAAAAVNIRADRMDEEDDGFATGLSNCITKDGQSTTSQPIPLTYGAKFPATQNASADPNTLDDYEEGVFTPAITFGGAAVGVTYSSRSGSYTKIGNRVFFNLSVVLSSKGSSTGTFQLTSLPFASSAVVPVTIVANNLTAGAGGMLMAETTAGTAIGIYNFNSAAGTVANFTDVTFTNNTDFQIAGNYPV